MRWKLPVGRWSIFFFLFFSLLLSILIFLRSEKKSGSLMWIAFFLFASSNRSSTEQLQSSFFFLFFFPSKFFIYRIQHRKEFKSRQTLNEVTRRRIYFSRGKRINASSRVKNFQRQFTALLRFDSSKMYSNCRWVFIIHSCLS